MEFVSVTGYITSKDGDIYQVKPLLWAEEVDESVADGLEIYTVDERGAVDVLAFDGEQWLIDERPELPLRDVPPDELPKVEYVDQRFELVLAQMDAVTAALVELAPASPAVGALVARSADVRAAVEFDDEATMDELIAEFRSEGVSASVAGAGQVAGKSRLEAAEVAGQGQGGA